MIFTKIYIDNLYSFHECEIDLSISGRSKSTIPYEYLKGCEKFRFRRVCIISGANASGKTALGKILWNVQILHSALGMQENLEAQVRLFKSIKDKNKPATIRAEFVTWSKEKNKYLFNKLLINLYYNERFSKSISNVELENNDDIDKARNKINKNEQLKQDDLFKINSSEMQWMYVFSDNDKRLRIAVDLVNKDVLKQVLFDMDSSIIDIIELSDKNKEESDNNKKRNVFQIIFDNEDEITIDKYGFVSDSDRLSSGTCDSLYVAVLLSKMIGNKEHNDIGNSNKTTHTYFLDERMSKVHSELEINILNLMIDKLPHNAQLFYTTHNYDVLSEMNLPIHSFLFMGKENGITKIIQPEQEEIFKQKKNRKKLLQFLKNDFFQILPKTKGIDNILFDDNKLFGE